MEGRGSASEPSWWLAFLRFFDIRRYKVEESYRDILNDALDDLRGLEASGRRKIIEHYAPKLAAIRAEPDAAKRAEMLDAVMTNVKLSASIGGVRAETLSARTIVKILMTAAKVSAVAAPIA